MGAEIFIPIVVGLVEAAKRAGLPTKFAPLFAIVLGLFLSFGEAGGDFSVETVVNGLVYGLTASGLYSVSQSVLNGKTVLRERQANELTQEEGFGVIVNTGRMSEIVAERAAAIQQSPPPPADLASIMASVGLTPSPSDTTVPPITQDGTPVSETDGTYNPYKEG